MNDYDKRQYNLMADKIRLFKENKIHISSLIDDLEGLVNLLQEKDPSWEDKFGDLWEDLEEVFSVSLSEDREFFSSHENEIINKAVNELEKMVRTKLNVYEDVA